jgi:hypothetical protein
MSIKSYANKGRKVVRFRAFQLRNLGKLKFECLVCGYVDYFDRYARHFARVEKHASVSFPEKHQFFECEDRRQWPTKECPLRPAMPGEKHGDVVPVCYVAL